MPHPADSPRTGRGPVRICFVCLGNICRSPTAAAVMAHRAAAEGVRDRLVIASAGTAGWHVGAPADPRSAAELARRGVPLDHAARRFGAGDFARFDMVLAMDHDNVAALHRMAPDRHARDRVALLRAFDPEAGDDLAVPDPYYGGDDGFRDVFEMVDRACRGVIAHLRAAGRL